ncbi:MAG: photosynthetic complex assembly protein PuhC [Rhodoferax sp.]|nr:photosynthetic complex assembly protein PuhC [Rhodoferax sp.]
MNPSRMPGWRLPHPIMLMVSLAIAALLAAALARLTGLPVDRHASPVQWERSLYVQDGSDGSILIFAAPSGKEIARLQGEQGFARGALRALARERKRHGLGWDLPFQLRHHADGSLTLSDDATGEKIHLESFGPAQRAVFASLQLEPAQGHPHSLPQGVAP